MNMLKIGGKSWLNGVLLTSFIFAVFSTFTLFLTGNASAEPLDKQNHLDSEQQSDQLERAQREISAGLVGTAQWIDSFFDDGRYVSEVNRTRAAFKWEGAYSHYYDFDSKTRISLRLHFPRLKKKVNLLLRGADDDEYDYDEDPVQPGDDIENDRDSLETSLQYFLFDSLEKNLSTTFGGSYNYFYGGVRYRYLRNWQQWNFRFSDSLRWYTDEGWENKIVLDLERKISKNVLFRSITSGIWEEEEGGIAHSQQFRVYSIVKKDLVVLWEAGAYLDTEPEYRLVDIQTRIRFRQRLFRDWLVFEAAPQLSWPEEHGHDANPGILFKLEAIFGYRSAI